MSAAFSQEDSFIYHEMLVHPAFFTHPHPHKIIILNSTAAILSEVLKHSTVTEIHAISPAPLMQSEARIQWHATPNALFAATAPASIDLLLVNEVATDFSAALFKEYQHLLNAEGILIHGYAASLFDAQPLKSAYQQLHHHGFQEIQLLHFAQPSATSGQRMLLMATVRTTFRRIREKDIFNRSFSTRYYNYDMHRSALGLPEFVRHELALEA